MRLRPSARPGGTTVITALLLVPLLALCAFAVDLNYLWRADAELQAAADAAAQAGATKLMGFAVQSVQPGLTPNKLQTLQSNATAAVQQRAIAFGQMYHVADATLVVAASDVELGFIADPSAAPDTPAGQFQTDPDAPFPNSVRVTVRRDGTVSTGPVRLLFGPVVGTPTSARQAIGIATLRGQNVTGFQGSNSGLLPLALSLTYYQYLTGALPAPPGVLQDKYTVQLRTDGGPPPPGNVSGGGDGCPEVTFFPTKDAPGNYGLVSLSSAPTSNQTVYANWILNGPSAADLASFGPGGLQATAAAPRSLWGGPGLKASLATTLATTIGQPRVVLLTGPPTGAGSTLTYPVVGFTGATVVAVDKYDGVSLQLCPIVSANATLGGGSDTGPGRFVYRGISLTR
jgi:Flp pilus assembly protein TadG